mmetsp:Transcript_68002/g.159450  ORF Transcript_68002/g.159450 Transcript_68002/m.159450 type:complete len:234 (-) Transcript_68002:72-773(-)
MPNKTSGNNAENVDHGCQQNHRPKQCPGCIQNTFHQLPQTVQDTKKPEHSNYSDEAQEAQHRKSAQIACVPQCKRQYVVNNGGCNNQQVKQIPPTVEKVHHRYVCNEAEKQFEGKQHGKEYLKGCPHATLTALVGIHLYAHVDSIACDDEGNREQKRTTANNLEKPFACGNAADLPEAPRVLLLSLHVGCCLLLPLNLHCKIGLFRQGKPPSTRCMPLMCVVVILSVLFAAFA